MWRSVQQYNVETLLLQVNRHLIEVLEQWRRNSHMYCSWLRKNLQRRSDTSEGDLERIKQPAGRGIYKLRNNGNPSFLSANAEKETVSVLSFPLSFLLISVFDTETSVETLNLMWVRVMSVSAQVREARTSLRGIITYDNQINGSHSDEFISVPLWTHKVRQRFSIS